MASTERAPLQREAIIANTRALISEDGLDQLTLRRLASRLGVTAPALYGHFEDKADLLRALAEDEFSCLQSRFDAIEADDPLDRIRALNRAYANQARENPELFRVMFLFAPDLGDASGLPQGVELPAATKVFGAAAEAVVAAIDSGAIEAADPLLVALTLWSAVHGVATVCQLGFGLTKELEDALVDEVIDRVLRGYAPDS
ncbi:MAG: TetR/AcrR family transcriptional regulator [Aquihabitans sp.]